ncbi:MAG TPA: hypothetical protein VFP84_20445, partial [Kofleriaceae bacterium]|nr:hypothetical protein [Kofleriaceae bacterium]
AAMGSAAMGSAGSGAEAGSGSAMGSAMGSAGSAAAGSDGAADGSAAGSDAAAAGSAAGSGSAAATGDATTMTHRAGMCPSTVLGAVTTSAVKGKAVVVTIESTDRDAVAAIQKRTTELLAEKKTAATANSGGGHDMKGSHGGSQGLCPVYVPDGAKATAKNAAHGVVVTIQPKDKVDQLATDITARIDRAAAWVKANVPDAPQGNQGGVGGGKGQDGSNHSGRGDGKGHERRQGGTGGGKGTGGGGGGGTGGGDGKAS